MQDIISLIDQNKIFLFLLLFARILSFVAFMPVFGHKSVNAHIRVGLAFYICIFLFPLVDKTIIINESTFLLNLISEITLGLVASILMNIIFAAVQIIGDLIGFATALSMANMFDPATGTQQGIISRFLYLIILVVYFESGMYEVTLLLLSNSIDMIHLGQFSLNNYNGISIVINEMKNMFLFAFSFAFPLFFISFILDVYYGYGTKSMPSFSPFIVTFQIKFTMIFIFLMIGMDIVINSFTQYVLDKLN